MNTATEKVDVLAVERDARTIYDVVCIRKASAGATREDVEFKVIALRNWQHAVAVAELVAAAEVSVPDLADSRLDGHGQRYDRLRAALRPFTEGSKS